MAEVQSLYTRLGADTLGIERRMRAAEHAASRSAHTMGSYLRRIDVAMTSADRSAGKMMKRFDQLANRAGTAAAADAWSHAASRIDTYAESSRRALAVQDDLSRVAQRSRSAPEPTEAPYAGSAPAPRGRTKPQNDPIRLASERAEAVAAASAIALVRKGPAFSAPSGAANLNRPPASMNAALQRAPSDLTKVVTKLGAGLLDAVEVIGRRSATLLNTQRGAVQQPKQDEKQSPQEAAVKEKAADIAKGLSEALLKSIGGNEKPILLWFRGLIRQMGEDALKQKIILPITTSLVETLPTLFGVGAKSEPKGGGAGGNNDDWLPSELKEPLWTRQVERGKGADGKPRMETVDGPSALQLGQDVIGGVLAAYSAGKMAKPGNKGQGALYGAATGAMIGTKIFPGWGTLIGTIVGAIAGAIGAGNKPSNNGAGGSYDIGTGSTALWDSGPDKRNQGVMQARSQIVDAIARMTEMLRGVGASWAPGTGVGFGIGSRDDWQWSVGNQSGKTSKEDPDAFLSAILKSLGQQASGLGADLAFVLHHATTTKFEQLLKDLTFADEWQGKVTRLNAGMSMVAEAFERGADRAREYAQTISTFLSDTTRVFASGSDPQHLLYSYTTGQVRPTGGRWQPTGYGFGGPGDGGSATDMGRADHVGSEFGGTHGDAGIGPSGGGTETAATGTMSAKPTLYWVGEEGPELIRRGFANGTPGAPPGWAWVGERGPELVKMRGGETVLPNHISMQYARAVQRGFAEGTDGWERAVDWRVTPDQLRTMYKPVESGLLEARNWRNFNANFLSAEDWEKAFSNGSAKYQDPNTTDWISQIRNPSVTWGDIARTGPTALQGLSNEEVQELAEAIHGLTDAFKSMNVKAPWTVAQAEAAIDDTLVNRGIERNNPAIAAAGQAFRDALGRHGITAETYGRLDALSRKAAAGERIDPKSIPDTAPVLSQIAAVKAAFDELKKAIPDSLVSLEKQMTTLDALRRSLDAEVAGNVQTLTEHQAAIEETRGYWKGMEETFKSVGWEGTEATNKLKTGLANALAKLADTWQHDMLRTNRQSRGLGAINSVEDIIGTLNTNAADAAAHGRSDRLARDTFNADVANLFESLDPEQFQKIRREIEWTGASLKGSSPELVRNILAIADGVQRGAEATETAATARQTYVSVLNREVSKLEQASASWTNLGKSLKSARESMLLGEHSPLGPRERLEEARRQWEDTLRTAKGAAGVTLADQLNAAERLQSVGEVYLKASRDYWATSDPTAFQEVQAGLASVETVAQAQVRLADEALATHRSQLQKLGEISASLDDITVELARIKYETAAGAAGQNPYPGAGGTGTGTGNGTGGGGSPGTAAAGIRQTFLEYLNRAPTEQEIDYYNRQFAAGWSVDRFMAAVTGSSEYIAWQSDGSVAGGSNWGLNRNNHTEISNAVSQMYTNILGRSATAGNDTGWQSWTNAVLSGQMSLEDVRQQIANSPEAKGRGLRDGGIVGAFRTGGLVGNGVWDVDSVLARYAGGGHIALAGGEHVTRAPSVTPETYLVLDWINRTGTLPANDRWEKVRELRPARRGGTSETETALFTLSDKLDRLIAVMERGEMGSQEQRARIAVDLVEAVRELKSETAELPRRIAGAQGR